MVDRVYPVAAVSGAPSYDGRGLRQLAVAPFVDGATAARPIGARGGVRRGTSTATVTATSTTWTVNPHVGIIDAESANEAGPYVYSFDQVKTGAMTAASGSYARIDLISVQISDPAEADGSSTPSATIVYTPGTAAAPALPPQPPRSMVIAQINVPISGGGSPSVSWVAPYLTAPGGIIPVRNQAERDAITYASAERPVYVDQMDVATIYRNVGAGWVTVASASPWTAYTPVWTAPTTNPTVGSGGSLTGRYKLIGSKTAIVDISMIIGSSGASGGTGGAWSWSLPFANVGMTRVVSGYAWGSAQRIVAALVAAGGTTISNALDNTGAALDTSYVLTAGASVTLHVEIEVA